MEASVIETTDVATQNGRHVGLTIQRMLTELGIHPFDTVEWETRDARIGHGAKVAFEQLGVEFPKTWSQNSTNITAQKYFRGQLDSPERETSVRQMVGRVSGTITGWGRKHGYFATEEDADAFESELTHILLYQMAAFNSPVWFNVGFEENPQCSACFILSVDDHLDDILEWNTQEGHIFRGGSGSGINLSKIRASNEPLTKGGTASGPVSFMRGADAWAGTIKSGGKTRRAAKMVVLNIDHPDIREFIWCKAREEDKAEALRDAGFDMSIDGDGFRSIQYQNANNSVRVTDEFMRAVEEDGDWHLIARTTGKPMGGSIKARQLMRELAEAAHRCADPGVQYDTTINRWHTSPASGRINASNPCSEYMHVDDSACNLMSLNLMKFRRQDGTFDVETFNHAGRIMALAQEIIVGPSSYPTEQIGVNARAFRQLGGGYANLGAYLMSKGMPYDSDEGRGTAAAITALMTAQAAIQSALTAEAKGPYEHFELNREAHLTVARMHRDAAYAIPDSDCADVALLAAARKAWDEAVKVGEQYGYRNAQWTVLAPTGTISFLMDCDTTGVEPDFSLVKFKELVGGGQMTIVNQTIEMALATLGYDEATIGSVKFDGGKLVGGSGILRYVSQHNTIVGAPGLLDKHLSIFDVAVGERAISYMGHLRMMAAVQPFISGAISKTVNLPHEATVEDIMEAYIEAWKLGIKALAIYRDGSKTAQALRTGSTELDELRGLGLARVMARLPRSVFNQAWAEAFYLRHNPEWVDGLDEKGRRKSPNLLPTIGHSVDIQDDKGVKHRFFFHIGLHRDGTPSQVFMLANKAGSVLRGLMDQVGKSMSKGFKLGDTVPEFIKYNLWERYDPHGLTTNPDIREARSPTDYLAALFGQLWLSPDELEELGINTREVRARQTARLDGVAEEVTPVEPRVTATLELQAGTHAIGEGTCPQCGGMMQRTGACHTCSSCGHNTGCG